MQRNTGYFPTESLEPSGNRLFSRSALNEGDLFRGSLNLSPILRRAALLDLCRMDENSYPLSQWRDTVRYLTGDERDFASVKEIKAFIKQDMEAEG